MRRKVVLGFPIVLVAAIAATVVVVTPPPVQARISCIAGAEGPTTSVELYDAYRRVVAVMKATPCGPRSSELKIASSTGSKISYWVVLLRRGTCGNPMPTPLYRGDGWYMNPPVNATRLSRSKFVVELTRVGALTPWACGLHKGPLLLPLEPMPFPNVPTTPAPVPTITKMKPESGGYRGHAPFQTVHLASTKAGRATRVTVGATGGASGGSYVRLRPGTCRRLEAGHEIVLNDAQAEFTSVTVINIPLRDLVQQPFALEIMDGIGDNPTVDLCFDF